MKLKDIAHSRTGDKGDIINISVIAFDEKDYPLLLEQVTSTKVKQFLGATAMGKVDRYELPTLAAMNFVVQKALRGGVTRSLRIDKHGKTLSSILLEMPIDINH
ncbi:AtuA-related protein [Eudoraea sp.]|uniref:AtuA-related protein n=1 Tax=Eudoraea sp. TaxID=1979955 RepID=UPI003C75189C